MSKCLFCGIVERTVPSNIIYEDDEVLAFDDVNPQAPVHALVIPKRHVGSVDEAGQETALLGRLLQTCTKVANQKGIARLGYRLVVNTGTNGGQTVFHLHLHVLGGRFMKWPPG